MRGFNAVALALLVALSDATIVEAQPSVPPNTILMSPIRDATQWRWIEVEADLAGWAITRGTGTVRISRHRFRATLQLDPQAKVGANIALKGLVKNGVVQATETLLNTDANPVGVTGIIVNQSHGEVVAQRITFRGGQSGDASYLSLYRLVPRLHSGSKL